MRLFFGIYPPPEVLAEACALRDLARPLVPSARWIEDEKLHITLQFLGEHETDERALAAAETIAPPPFAISVGGLGDFGHVLWLGVHEAEPLVALAHELGRALVREGFVLEDRAYHPHLTLARVKRPHTPVLNGRTRAFVVREFHLIESRGGQYLTRASFTLERTPTPP